MRWIATSDQITLRSAVTNLSGFTRVRELIKLGPRAASNWRISNAWLLLLNSQPLLRKLVLLRPRLVYKVYRPYQSQALHSKQGLAALHDHHCFVFASGLGPLTLHDAHTLAAVPMERESALNLQLRHNHVVVCNCAFSFIAGEQGMLLAIGCVQGPKGADGLHLVREATRELYGWQPDSADTLAEPLGRQPNCVGMRKVGNQNRVAAAALRQGKMFADCDAFWTELDASRRTDGDFELTCPQISAPCLSAIPSSKRAGMRRRHAMLDGFAQAAFCAIARSSAQYA